MSYTALYRKYRPMTFSDVSGQEAVVTALRNQCVSSRIGHAYLFCGTRGTGKTTLAKIMARAVNCLKPKDGEPCNECSMCQDIIHAKSTDVIEMDAASHNGVDSIRRISDEVNYTPAVARFRVYIIDEAHMLSTGAFNALLKTLEEPPPYCIFILATTEAHKLPVTILSRCQRYDFKKLTREQIGDRVRRISDQEGFPISDRAVLELSGFADGAVRDALSILERCAAQDTNEEISAEMVRSIVGAADKSIYGEFLKSIFDGQPSEVLALFDRAVGNGLEPMRFADDFCAFLRDALLIKTAVSAKADSSDYGKTLRECALTNIIELSDEQMNVLAPVVSEIPLEALLRYLRVISELPAQLRYSASKRILCEVALIKLCRPEMESDYSSLLERVRVLEKRLENIRTEGFQDNKEAIAAPRHKTNWHKILGDYVKPAAIYAKEADVSVDDVTGNLILAFDNPVIADYFNIKNNLDALQNFIRERTDKDITLKITEIKEENSMTDIGDIIKMPIEYID